MYQKMIVQAQVQIHTKLELRLKKEESNKQSTQ
jgi:hypothetical protein